MSNVTVISSTETPEEVQAALTGKTSEETKSAPADEVEQGENTENSEASENEVEETEGESPDESETENEEETQDEKPKQKKGFKKRIDKLSRRLSEKDQEVDFLRRELEAARAQKNQPNETPKKAESEGEPTPDQFDTHAEYVKSLSKWTFAQEKKADEAKSQAENLKKSQASEAEKFRSRCQELTKTKYPDFKEAVDDIADVQLSPGLVEAMRISDMGPEVFYYLAKNPDKIEELNKLGPMAIAREVGKIEVKISSQESSPKTEKKTTKAPAPLKPVGGGQGSAKKSIYDESLSQAEYEKLRMAQRKKA